MIHPSVPWIAVSDLNAVLNIDEVSNTNSLNQRKHAGFQEWIDAHNLIDLGFTGPRFTWTKGNATNTFKVTKLDRALCDPVWRTKFDKAKAIHLPKLCSDHSPLLL